MNKGRLTWVDVIVILLVVGVIILAAIYLAPQVSRVMNPGPDNLFMGSPWI